MLCHTNSIHKNIIIFGNGIGGDIPQHVIVNGAHTSPFHLDIEWFGGDIAHEHYNFKWLHISTGGNKSACHSYSETLIIAELTDEFGAVTG